MYHSVLQRHATGIAYHHALRTMHLWAPDIVGGTLYFKSLIGSISSAHLGDSDVVDEHLCGYNGHRCIITTPAGGGRDLQAHLEMEGLAKGCREVVGVLLEPLVLCAVMEAVHVPFLLLSGSFYYQDEGQ